MHTWETAGGARPMVRRCDGWPAGGGTPGKELTVRPPRPLLQTDGHGPPAPPAWKRHQATPATLL